MATKKTQDAADKAAADKAEDERIEAEKAEAAKAEGAAAEKEEADQAEAKRLAEAAAEKVDAEKAEAEKRDAERIEAEKQAAANDQDNEGDDDGANQGDLFTPTVKRKVRTLVNEQLALAERDFRSGPGGSGWTHNESKRAEVTEWVEFLRAVAAQIPND